MNHKQPISLAGIDDANATVQLVTFGETLFNGAGRITPSDAGFALELEGKKRAKVYPLAITAVRKLRKAGRT